ncbi:cystatin-1-like [Crotalus tigris]|uniref:cystatin-1-like n=1 Tax=Crotalus tigris TaxID=88082 RepID=UPI00192F5F5E|nr:cystatin-1-like [Crotalus tigris]
MAHSQMPCPLVVLCSLLMLPTVLLQVGVPGGLSPASVTDEGVQNAAAFAVEQYNERSDNTNYFKVLRIVKAETQVVAGAKYYLTVEIGETVCEKSNGPMTYSEIQNCELLPQGKKLTCNFEVWSRPWLNENQVTSMSCF